jgi:hypothetical protein
MFPVGESGQGFQSFIHPWRSCMLENEEGRMSDELRKELWEKGIAYLLQEYT